jgi:dTDP-4-amino-4,6-dideoxygalactose transaminase
MSTYKGQHLGTIGDFGCFSFHETKTFISGEGGAITINSEEHIELAEIMREKGTNRSKFFRGEVDKYTWVSLGSSFLPSELAAAFLYGQLTEAQKIVAKRKAIFDLYDRLLQPLVERGLIEVSSIPEDCTTNYHMYYILVKDLETRTGLIDFLRKAGVLAVFHYVPLHLSSYAKSIGIDLELPVTEELADRLIRLPFFNCIEEGEQEYVVEHIFHFFKVAPIGIKHTTTSPGVSPQKKWSGDESRKSEGAGSAPGGSPVRSR